MRKKVLRSRAMCFGLICRIYFYFLNKIVLIYTRIVHKELLPRVGVLDWCLKRRRQLRCRRFAQFEPLRMDGWIDG